MKKESIFMAVAAFSSAAAFLFAALSQFLVLTFFLSSPVTGADAAPTIDNVIAQYAKAVGDRRSLEKNWALELRGHCESSVAEESGPIQVIVQGPKIFMQLSDGDLLMGVNQDTFWRHPRGGEILKIPAGAMAETVAIFDSARVLHWKEKFPAISVTGTQQVDGSDAYVIETKPGDPSTERLFIDRRSGLLIREEILAKHEVFTFADFHLVDGIQVPFTIHQSTPGPSYTYKFSEAKHVAEVDDAMFAPR
ncbi:MAG: hypothetical protein JO065_06945 [Acidobacteria bacterium]|nr:hypothetical protein [Acidobacteriota bacterium]